MAIEFTADCTSGSGDPVTVSLLVSIKNWPKADITVPEAKELLVRIAIVLTSEPHNSHLAEKLVAERPAQPPPKPTRLKRLK